MNTADPLSSDALDGFAEEVAERVTGGGTYHLARLLPEDDPTPPDRPQVWKDEDALNEWVRGLPSRDTAIVLRVVAPNPEPFETEIRSPNANDTDR